MTKTADTDPVLVTGAHGFVGGHLLSALAERGRAAEADVTDPRGLAVALRDFSPRAVVHLAALSSVSDSWADPLETWRVNALGTVNVLAAVRAEASGARVLVVSTGEVYGRAESVPTAEEAPTAPLSPYAASKLAAEVACAQAARSDGVDVVVARAFPHIGPGQDERFAIGSWTRRIARLEAEGGGVLPVGTLDVQRDFTDVRDVARAYVLMLDPKVPAGTYNVASGAAVSLRDVLDMLLDLADAEIEVVTEAELVRPVDVPLLAGDSTRLREATGWQPAITLDRSLGDALDVARTLVKSGNNEAPWSARTER